MAPSAHLRHHHPGTGLLSQFVMHCDTLWKLRGYLESVAAAHFFSKGLFNFVLRSQMTIFTTDFEPLSFCLSYCLSLLDRDLKTHCTGFSLVGLLQLWLNMFKVKI